MTGWTEAFKKTLVDAHKAKQRLPACPDDGQAIREVDSGTHGLETMLKCSHCGEFETNRNEYA